MMSSFHRRFSKIVGFLEAMFQNIVNVVVSQLKAWRLSVGKGSGGGLREGVLLCIATFAMSMLRLISDCGGSDPISEAGTDELSLTYLNEELREDFI